MPKVSLNYVWDKLLANGDGKIEVDEVTTPVTITFADGRSTTATLCLTPYGEGSDGLLDLDMDMNKLHELHDPEEEVQSGASEDYGRDGVTLVQIDPKWSDG